MPDDSRPPPFNINPITRPVAAPPATLTGVAFRELQLDVHCTACRRILSLDAWRVGRVAGYYGDLTLEAFARRMRCTGCRRRGARVEVLEPLRRPAGWQPQHGPVR
jgi:hypothetical protein